MQCHDGFVEIFVPNWHFYSVSCVTVESSGVQVLILNSDF